jgi:hypothetical protein
MLGGLFEQLQIPVQLLSASGQFLLDIRSTHQVNMSFQDWHHETQVRQDTLEPFTVENTYSGTAQALLGVTPTHKACIRVTSDQSQIASTLRFPESEPIETITPAAISSEGGSPDNEFTMRCSASRMTWTARLPAGQHRGPVTLEGALNRLRN